ncbi:HVO_0649 family zinc finger protein [Natronorubrum sulfidifaciens]|uniref:Small CPxCG-related zinc finger protein n=1 Tax=Natronorubrum sulfidifaciens JCM 14089 TaxID=1230460 RepID=L9W4H6_9EURY|nr:HVO_0649 family zinc finger protein [Natronorubrum sulfidifaciens]ELY44242.1 hypothetical protein C495_10084 [Natronorubrum sulfidifaciens JCM 14089]
MSSARSPFEQLRDRFNETDLECSACGYIDADGSWRVSTTGSRVTYQFMCPTCDAVETREMRL